MPLASGWKGMKMYRFLKPIALAAALGTLSPSAPAVAAAFGTIARAQAGPSDPFCHSVTDNQSGPTFSSASASAGGSTAFASASLATGKLKLSGSTSSGCGVAGSQVAFFDQVTFDLPDDLASIDVPFQLVIDGSVGGSDPDQASVSMTVDGIATGSGPGTVPIASILNHPYLIHLLVHDGEQVDFNVAINASRTNFGGPPGFYDLSHTGVFSIDLPTGVTFSSASGVFLTDTTGIPEPASWALMILGFGGVGAAVRRRRSKALIGA